MPYAIIYFDMIRAFDVTFYMFFAAAAIRAALFLPAAASMLRCRGVAPPARSLRFARLPRAAIFFVPMMRCQ